jgi:hypothetical protein
MSNVSLLKRLETLEQAIRLKRPRQITILIDGNSEDQPAAGALVQDLAPGKDDLVILLKRYGDPDPDLPRLLAVTDL